MQKNVLTLHNKNNRFMKNIALAIIALFICGSAFSKPKTISLKIIETSDVHGSFFPYDFANRQPRFGTGRTG